MEPSTGFPTTLLTNEPIALPINPFDTVFVSPAPQPNIPFLVLPFYNQRDPPRIQIPFTLRYIVTNQKGRGFRRCELRRISSASLTIPAVPIYHPSPLALLPPVGTKGISVPPQLFVITICLLVEYSGERADQFTVGLVEDGFFPD